jgi:hypothetical protein
VKRAVGVIAAVGLLGCAGERAPAGLSEPLVVRTASFKSGPLPGDAPVAADAGTPAGPRVTAIGLLNAIAFAGRPGKSVTGRTSTDAVAIAVSFADAGSGYWIQPLGAPDTLNGGGVPVQREHRGARTSSGRSRPQPAATRSA